MPPSPGKPAAHLPKVNLLCTVRGCRLVLRRDGGSMICPAGHSFNVARSGYVNLLQPQDSRSRRPGDSRETARARRRVLDAGHEAPFLEALGEIIGGLGLPDCPSMLDVGCGEGHFLGSIARAPGAEGHGLDISAQALDLAARRWPAALFVAANADRFLPYPDGSFHLVMSLTGPRNPVEFGRVLAPGGALLVAVPGADDLVEARTALLGEGVLKERTAKVAGEFACGFRVAARHTVRHSERLTPAILRDLMASTYRGGRGSRLERLLALGEMDVTMSREVVILRPSS